MTRIAILGGGPGGYEAALVAAQLGAEVVVVDRDGLGGACVLADCVPSKTLIATSESMTSFACSEPLGVRLRSGAHPEEEVTADLGRVNARVKALALAQSLDIGRLRERECLHPGVDPAEVGSDLLLRVRSRAQPHPQRLAAGERRHRLAGRDQRLRRHAVGEDAGPTEAVTV